MQLTSQETLPVTQAQAWAALNDIELLRRCITGCESITPVGDDSYEVFITAAIGPVRAKFKGKLALENLQPPQSYTLRFEGSGGAAGHGKGSADIRLESTDAQVTVLHYNAQASVGGKIAQIGSRLVDMAAQKMAGDFFAAFNAELQQRHPPAEAPATAPVPTGLWVRLAAWWRGLFGSGAG